MILAAGGGGGRPAPALVLAHPDARPERDADGTQTIARRAPLFPADAN